jgi:hypothetical protein
MRTIKDLALLTLLLTLTATPLVADQGEKGPPARESYLLQVVLLLGKLDGPSSTSNIPRNTIQTLKDVETFLPYKSYQLLDTSLIRSDGHASSVLHGPSGRKFHLSLGFRTEQGEKGERLSFQQFRIDAPPVPPRAPGGEPGLAPPAPSGPILSSSFTVDVGETIVVGTSKLNGGDQALLVLLTVIP